MGLKPITNNPAADDGDLVEQMGLIRNASEPHVAGMHYQAARVADWREHVRSHPLVAVSTAALTGYVLVSKLRSLGGSNGGSVVESARRQSSTDDDASVAMTSIASGAMAFVGSMASAMLKQYVSGYVRNRIMGANNDSGRASVGPGKGVFTGGDFAGYGNEVSAAPQPNAVSQNSPWK